MSSDRSRRGREIFEAAIEHPEEERSSFVADACAGDPELLDEVESLLRHFEDDEESVLRSPPGAPGVAGGLRAALRLEAAGPFEIGAEIGPYVIRDRLGEGGTSLVYRAFQIAPVRREVAIKVLKPGMDSASVLARFDTERQLLAAMEHPNIAQVFDAGISRGGLSYIVMELIRGVPINEFCDGQRLDVMERLGVFFPVCQAVHYAHMRGVIHRDLKPSNVLVAEHEGTVVPKIIDFGISKAIHFTGENRHTQLGQPVGTPAYMSPEQWESKLDLDVRADVYSLGVVLYELLSGHYPFPFETTEAGDLRSVRAAMESSDPVRPSTRIATHDGEAVSPIGGVPRSEVARTLRGDLDWIVLKAISKDRSRRYRSVEAFAADLRRYCRREPVEARPASMLYRCRMFCKRHQALSTACAIGLLAFLVGLGAVVYHGYRVERELAQKEKALVRAEIAEAEAERRAVQLQVVADFQSEQLGTIVPERMGADLRERIVAAAPPEVQGELRRELGRINFTNIGMASIHANVFDPAREAISEHFADQPAIQAQLFQTLAKTLQRLGLYDAATEPQERAITLRREVLGDDHEDTLASISSMGVLLRDHGRLDEAEAYTREALDARRRTLGDDHPATLASVKDMGWLLLTKGKPGEAERYLREALEGRRRVLGAEHPDTLGSLYDMGHLSMAAGNADEAERIYLETLERRRLRLGDDHPDTLATISNLGTVLQMRGRLDEAAPYLREALDGSRRVLGDDHPNTLSSLVNISVHLRTRDRPGEAERLCREAVDGCRRALGQEHQLTLLSLSNLSDILNLLGRYAESEAVARECLEVGERVMGADHWLPAEAKMLLGEALVGQARFDEAEPLLRSTLNSDGLREHRLSEMAQRLVAIFEASGRAEQADEWRRRSGASAKEPEPIQSRP